MLKPWLTVAACVLLFPPFLVAFVVIEAGLYAGHFLLSLIRWTRT
jgi:hypothetical protein